MITLFIMGLAGMAILFGALPVVVFALMLETCAERQGKSLPLQAATVRPPARVRAGLRFAA